MKSRPPKSTSSTAAKTAASARHTQDADPEGPLTVQEKRLFVARIVRADFLECFDENGEFDLDRAREVLPPGSLQKITVHQTTRTDRQGNPVVNRRITLHLVDKLRAIRADEILLKQEGAERTQSEEERKTIRSLNESQQRLNDFYAKWRGERDEIREALVEARQEILHRGGGWDPRRYPAAEEFLKTSIGEPMVRLPRDRNPALASDFTSSEPARPPP